MPKGLRGQRLNYFGKQQRRPPPYLCFSTVPPTGSIWPAPRPVGFQAFRGVDFKGAQGRRRGRFADVLALRLRLEARATKVMMTVVMTMMAVVMHTYMMLCKCPRHGFVRSSSCVRCTLVDSVVVVKTKLSRTCLTVVCRFQDATQQISKRIILSISGGYFSSSSISLNTGSTDRRAPITYTLARQTFVPAFLQASKLTTSSTSSLSPSDELYHTKLSKVGPDQSAARTRQCPGPPLHCGQDMFFFLNHIMKRQKKLTPPSATYRPLFGVHVSYMHIHMYLFTYV